MSTSPLARILGAITPPPVVLTPDYDGLEYRWKFLTFRPARACSPFSSVVHVFILCTGVF